MNDAAAVNAFLDQVESAGTTDILINNVGASPSRNFLYMSDDDWHDLIELNLMSAVRCTRRLLPAMRKQRWGRVVMVASAAAKYPGAALIDYAATRQRQVRSCGPLRQLRRSRSSHRVPLHRCRILRQRSHGSDE